MIVFQNSCVYIRHIFYLPFQFAQSLHLVTRPVPPPGQLTWVEDLLCRLVHRVSLQDDICPPLVCTDVGFGDDLCGSQVVFNSSGGCGTGHRGQNLLVVPVSEV